MTGSFYYLGSVAMFILLSWIGLGWLAAKLLRAHRIIHPRWPLLAAIGMCVTITIGGITNLCTIASAPLLVALSILSFACALLLGLAHLRRWNRPRRRTAWMWLIPPIVLASSIFLSSIVSTRLNPGDDQLAYMLFPRQMLQTGTLLTPFNMRRLGTYGGQQFLQAQILAVSQTFSPEHGERDFTLHGNILDTGLCALISAGLLWTLMRPRSPKQTVLASLLVTLFLLIAIPRVNTHAQMSGTLLFLALFHILKILRLRPAMPVAILAGLLAAALSTLRMNFLPAAVVAILFCAWQLRDSRTLVRPRVILSLSIALCVTIGALLPWAIVSYHSSGTPLYPLFNGFQQGSFLASPLSLPDHLAWTFSTISFPPILILLAPLALAPWSRRFHSTLPFYVAAIVTTVATAWTYTAVDAWMIYRYCSPLLIAAAFAGLAMLLSKKINPTTALIRGALCLAFILPCILASSFSEAFRAAYPILLVPTLALALCLPKATPRLLRTILFLLITSLIILGAIRNFPRMADNNGLFFYFAAVSGLAATAYFSRSLLIKRIAAATCTALAIASLIGISRIFGPTLMLSMLVLAAAAFALFFLMRTRLTSTRRIMVTAIIVVAVFVAIANLPFIVDTFSRWLIAAFIAALAHFTWPAPSTAKNLVATFAITLLCLATPAARISFDPAAQIPAELHYDQQRSLYQQAQASIPPAARIFTLVSDPVFLNFRRNPINESDDEIEFISPPPKIPLTDSPLLLCRYFQTLGVRYLILSNITLDHGRLPPLFRRALAELAATKPILFQSQDLTVIDLKN